jgi:hypothetical protein
MATLRAKDFTPGIPFDLTLTSLSVTEAPDNGYGAAWVFRSNLGSIYLPEAPARAIITQLETQGIQPNEAIRFTQVKTIGNGSRWIVDRAPSLQRQLEDSLANVRSIQSVPPAQPAQPIAAPPAPEPARPQTQSLRFMGAYKDAIDVLLEAKEYAQRKGLAIEIRCEDVRALAATIMIDAQKGCR